LLWFSARRMDRNRRRSGSGAPAIHPQIPSKSHKTKKPTIRASPVQSKRNRTCLVHNGVMRTTTGSVRQSVSLPADVAEQVRSLAKARRLSANRMLLELIENGMEAEKRKQQEFFDLAERFRKATDPREVKLLGDQMGRMVFGS